VWTGGTWDDPIMWFLLRLVAGALALWITTLIFDDRTLFGREATIELTDDTAGARFVTLILVALIFGIVNAVLQPIIKIIGCAVYVLTLGLIAIVVNGALLMLTDWIADDVFGLGFRVANFWPSAVLGALVIGIVSWLLGLVARRGAAAAQGRPDRGPDYG
jgi:putative membrane protein